MSGGAATVRRDAAPVEEGTGRRHRVALVTNIPTPYRNPCYRELARLCDLRVLFSALREPDRDWSFGPEDLDFPHEVISSLSLTRQRRRPDLGMKASVFTQISPGLPKALSRFRPEIVVAAAFGPSAMMALAWARWHRARFVLWSEGTRHTEANLHYLRLTQRSLMVRRADAFWSNGALSTELLDSYGRGSAQPVTEGMTGIDTRELRRTTEALAPRRTELRRKLGLSGTVFLFVGSVIELKGVPQMARAFTEAMAPGGLAATLMVAGRGALSDVLGQSLAGVPGLELKQLGFVEPARLAELYAAADVFILPTLSDNWSLAVLEAAVAGVPQILSVHNGGSRDLAQMGAAGVMVDPLDGARLAATIRTFAASPPARSAPAVLDAISAHYAPEAFAQRAVAAFDALDRPA